MSSDIYYGIRNNEFNFFIEKLLDLSNLKSKYKQILLQPENLEKFKIAFTHKSVDPDNNYELYELLGDAVLGHALVWYLYNRFPQVRCPSGIDIISKLKNRLGSKKSLSSLSDKLDFEKYISISLKEKDEEYKMMSLLEDTFESFIGIMSLILDETFGIGIGYNVTYSILKRILDKEEISTEIELKDNKTSLKEIFDKNKDKLGEVKYITSKVGNIYTTNIFAIKYSHEKMKVEHIKIEPEKHFTLESIPFTEKIIKSQILLGTDNAKNKKESEQKAAEKALKMLCTKGIELGLESNLCFGKYS